MLALIASISSAESLKRSTYRRGTRDCFILLGGAGGALRVLGDPQLCCGWDGGWQHKEGASLDDCLSSFLDFL